MNVTDSVSLFGFLIFCLSQRHLAKTFLPFYNQGMVDSCPLCSAAALEWRNLHYVVGLEVNKLGWQSTFDYCRGCPTGILCLITPVLQVDLCLITLGVCFFPVIAGSHEDLFLFLAGVCHGALSMCKHLCLEVCQGAGGGGDY